ARAGGGARNRAGFLERLDVLARVTERLEDLARVLAECRAGALGAGRCAPELDRGPDLAHRTVGAGLVELDDHLARAHELRVERLVEIEQRLETAVVLRGELGPVVARALEEDPLDLGVRVGARPLELLLD